MALSPLDAVILVTYLAGVTLFGAWIGRGAQTSADYLLGDRRMPWWAVLGSIVATETSTATFLSVPGLTYRPTGNLGFLQLALGFLLGRIVIAVLLLPLYFRGRLFTAYEVLRDRFGRRTQRAASLLFLLTRNLGDGLRLFLAAIVLQEVAGIDLQWCIVIIGLSTIVYTFLGGMKAVIWNDCIQFVVYVAGGAAALWLIVNRIDGGWDTLFAFGRREHKLQMFDLRFSLTEPFTLWAGLIGGSVLSLGTHGTDQMMVQRYLSSPGLRDAARAVILSGVVVFVQFLLFLTVGIALACFYASHAPEIVLPDDQVFASFIVNELPTGLVGVILAAVFSAAMSTLSSSLNSSAGAVVNDFLSESVPAERHLTVSRQATVGFGLLQILIGVAASYWSDSVVSDALAIAGFSAGILLGVFVIGLSATTVSETDVVSAMAVAVLTLALIHFLTNLAWPWNAPVGALTTIVACRLAGLRGSATRGDPESATPDDRTEKRP